MAQSSSLSGADKLALWRHMRVPTYSFVALLLLLGGIVLLGAIQPFAWAWILEALLAVTMVAIVLLFSMELLKEPSLMRVVASIGFLWVLILMSFTVLDYLTR